MAYNSIKELARTNIYEVGKRRQLERKWVVTLGDNTLSGTPFQENEIAGEIELGKTHPTYPDYRIRKITYTEGYEGSPYHVLVKAEYDLIYARERTSPTAREAVWSAESSPGEVPALSYYDGNTLKALTNSAGDYFPGLITHEALVGLTYEKNYASFPGSLVGSQNYVNSDVFAGCGVHTLKVVSVTVNAVAEEFNNAPVRYWKAVAKIQYRQSSHNLLLPDVGWNFLDNGQRYRAMVFDFQNEEWIPSPGPVALDGFGGIAQTPAILNRRVYPQTSFGSLFGTFPTSPPDLASS